MDPDAERVGRRLEAVIPPRLLPARVDVPRVHDRSPDQVGQQVVVPHCEQIDQQRRVSSRSGDRRREMRSVPTEMVVVGRVEVGDAEKIESGEAVEVGRGEARGQQGGDDQVV